MKYVLKFFTIISIYDRWIYKIYMSRIHVADGWLWNIWHCKSNVFWKSDIYFILSCQNRIASFKQIRLDSDMRCDVFYPSLQHSQAPSAFFVPKTININLHIICKRSKINKRHILKNWICTLDQNILVF